LFPLATLFGLVKKKRVAFIDLIEMHIEGSKLARESYRSSQRERESVTYVYHRALPKNNKKVYYR
jgi:hypothetical protein